MSSSVRDLSRYYQNSIIPFRHTDGSYIPFYVQEVIGRDEYEFEQCSFRGHMAIYVPEERAYRWEPNSQSLAYTKFELDYIPELGYVMDNRVSESPVWLYYKNPHHSCKGVTENRVNLQGDPNKYPNLLYLAWNKKPFAGKINSNLCVHDNCALYKGSLLGKKLKDGWKIPEVFKDLEELCKAY